MIEVDVKNAKLEFYKLRSRFQKLERFILADALMESSQPVVIAAQASAPVRSGRLRGRMGPTLQKRGSKVSVAVGAVRLSRADKGFPYWDRFMERGFTATGRAKKSKASGSARFIPGKHFIEEAGRTSFDRVSQIFSERIFQRFREIEESGITL